MAHEPLLDVPEGRPREARLGGPVQPAGAEDWFAGPPENTTPVETAPGELVPPGPATRQGSVDVPVEPG
jgi:hypothetical protein